ncbi:MAG: hypothetical protein COV67_04935, partial [Nitrospinae bacterium CG11_big_fil_rev_8_21_14_0_20_56_8]
TLLEMILVLLLVGLIAGLVTPIVASTLDRIELQSAARKLNSALRWARSEAVTRKTRFAFQGDIEHGRYWLTNATTEQNSHVEDLKTGIRMALFVNQSEPVSAGKFQIVFYPQGSTSGGTLYLETGEPGKPEDRYAISVDPVTGASHIRKDED